MEDKLY